MSSRSAIKTAKSQEGLALLIMVVVVMLGFGAYVLSGLSINSVKIEQKRKTQVALKKAKTALVAYAITHMDQSGGEGEMGYFPCPDRNGSPEGGSDGSCGVKKQNTIGYYPWASLETEILSDNSGSCLRYVVSGSYKNSPYSGMINEDSYGMLQVKDDAGAVITGTNPEDKLVALIVAPGGALSGQARTFDNTSFCGKDYGNHTEYLEGNGDTDNGTLVGIDDVDDQFIHATATSATEATPYNDEFVTITRDEIWELILSRPDFTEKMENLTQALAMCLAEYANLADNTSRRLPWPVITDLGATINYRDNANYQDDNNASNGYSGRFPFDVANSNAAIDAALSVNDLFDVANCSALTVGAGETANLLDPSDPGPPSIPATEYRKLWNNWKDHFFYVVSKGYEPASTGADECNNGPYSPPNPKNCIEVNGVNYAGAVVFSGKRLDGVTRDDKSVVADYLEDGKATVFDDEATNKTGTESYNYTDPQTDVINDIMYCIEDKPIGQNLSVVECS